MKYLYTLQACVGFFLTLFVVGILFCVEQDKKYNLLKEANCHKVGTHFTEHMYNDRLGCMINYNGVWIVSKHIKEVTDGGE